MITFCIPSKNNLRYLKTCITSIQENSHYEDNEILVFVDQDNDGTVDWLKLNGIKHIVNKDRDPKGIGYAYDKMFKKAKYNYVVAFHADMVLGPKADYFMYMNKTKDNVVCATRIEPPLHPPGPEKIVMDFGMWPEEINMEDFNEFVSVRSHNFKVTKGMFAPWLIHRDQHLGHDPIFKSVFEDADLFRRFVLAGYEMVQTWDAMVYHLTCRGGQFAHAEKMEDFQRKDDEWLNNNNISLKEYVRKWGGLFKESGPCEPLPNKKYDVGVEIKNCNLTVLTLEPYFSNLKVDFDYCNYVKAEQPYSSFNLDDKFVSELTNDVIMTVDLNEINPQDLYNIIGNIEDVMEMVKEPGDYEMGGVKIKVNKIEVKNPKIKL